MKTYTFKLFAAPEEVVIACHMQLEQFYDSMKLTEETFEKFLEKYPKAYLTASDYHLEDGRWYTMDSKIGTLKGLTESKSLKDWLLSSDFLDFLNYIEADVDSDDEVKEDAEV